MKLWSLIGSLLAIKILVLGNCFRVSSEARIGEINSFSLTKQSVKLWEPEYDERQLCKKGKGRMGSSKDKSIEGVMSYFDKLRPTLR